MYKSQIIESMSNEAEIQGLDHYVLLTGQTFDECGEPIDYLKQIFTLFDLHDELKNTKKPTASKVVVADHFLTLNKTCSLDEAVSLSQQRINYLNRIAKVYDGEMEVVRSSVLKDTEQYKQLLEKLTDIASKNNSVKEDLLKAVPEDKRHIDSAYLYPIEEIATILALGTNIKIGPPYEKFYDCIINDLSKKVDFIHQLVGVYNTISLPLGEFDINQIGSHGVTPYKANSKGLDPKKHRILMDKHEKSDIEQIISDTHNEHVLTDLTWIALAAERRLGKKTNCSNRDLSKKELADLIIYTIINPLRS